MIRILVTAALVALSSTASAQAIPVALSEWKIGMQRDTVKAGTVTFRVTNNGVMNHALYVRGEGVDEGTREISTRQSASITLKLKPGTYEFFCPMSDESHKLAGMARKLVVTPADPQAAPKKP